MKMSFNVPVFILDSCLAYTDEVIGKIEFTCKNNQLFIGATDNYALFLTQLSKFHNDGNMIGFGEFTFTFPARYIKGFIDGICKMKKITAKTRNMMFIEFRVSRDENKDVCVVMVDKVSETQSTVLKVLDYRNDNIYGTLVHNLPSLIEKNDPSKEEATHLPVKEYSRAKKVRKYIYLKGADPIFKENGWKKPAFIFDEKYIIVAQGFKPNNFMIDSDFWKNV